MAVVFTDAFTVGADANLDAYPAGSPDYAYLAGSGANLTVEAATDRVALKVASTFTGARIIDPAVPTGDQEITALCAFAPNFDSGEVRVRCAAGANTCYLLKIELASAAEVRLFRVIAGTHTLIASADRGFAGAGSALFRLKATGTNPVHLEAQIGATAVLTFDDSDPARLTSGPPGIGAWAQTFTNAWVDDVSVDDLAVGPGVLVPGTVPVRYVVGQIPNVVPVETVGAAGIGVVPVREFVGPANVVPVRETASETPRVKVVKV